MILPYKMLKCVIGKYLDAWNIEGITYSIDLFFSFQMLIAEIWAKALIVAPINVVFGLLSQVNPSH